MDPAKSISALKKLLEKYPLEEDEREAVLAAIGMLSWAGLSKSHIKSRKAKKERSAEWN
ncbi:MAG: hypothetical protein JW727_06550 [Candidatus Aenigmarchaeota archaeon]|nr:hypothetical protein [Candidatus Aenigmarchaeota archaeon]